jgi:hypothetical protein
METVKRASAIAQGILFYLALLGGAAVAQDAPRTELGARLVEHHGDGVFHRLEEVKLRQSVAYPDAAAVAQLKTPAGAYQAYLSTLAAVEEEAGVKTLLVNNVLGLGSRPDCDWDVVVVKHYPSWRAWEKVEGSALRKAAYVHREAAVANEHVVVAVPRLPAAATRQARPDDPSDTMIYVMNLIELREQAQYADGSHPGSTGMEAYRRYKGGGELANLDRELIIIDEVPAALNSADAHWTGLNIVRYPSLREFMRVILTSDFRNIHKNKEAAINRHCGPLTVPTLPESSVGAASRKP